MKHSPDFFCAPYRNRSRKKRVVPYGAKNVPLVLSITKIKAISQLRDNFIHKPTVEMKAGLVSVPADLSWCTQEDSQ